MIRDHDSMSWTTDAAMSPEIHQDSLGFGGTEGMFWMTGTILHSQPRGHYKPLSMVL